MRTSTPHFINYFQNIQPICPNSILPLKAWLVQKWTLLNSRWENYYKARPELFSDTSWVSWSTPQEILTQLWEWKPLQNVRLLTETLFQDYPLLTTQYIFLAITAILISFISAYITHSFSLKALSHREEELATLKLIKSHFWLSSKEQLYPSPNYRQKCKAKWFRLIPWVIYPLP